MSTVHITFDTLRLTQSGRVLTVQFYDPPYNFVSARMQRELDILTRAVDRDESIGAVVMTGGLCGRYITHGNVAHTLASISKVRSDPDANGGGARAESKRVAMRRMMRVLLTGLSLASRIPFVARLLESSMFASLLNVTRVDDVVMRILRSPAVYIAAINGPCGGMACELSACFDLRIAAEEDAGFILPELLIGLTTALGGQRLAQLIGPSRALEMMLEARMYSAREALAMGLVNHVVPAAELLETAQRLGARYAQRNRAGVGVQKRVFNEIAVRRPLDGLLWESAASAAGTLSGPAAKAMRAWVAQQIAAGGESPFLINLEPWREGSVVEMNEP
jgi:enoyl-CoA hydratase